MTWLSGAAASSDRNDATPLEVPKPADLRHAPPDYATRCTNLDYVEIDAIAYSALNELVRSGTAVAVVGAGVSVPADFPTWPELLATLRDEVRRHDAGFVDPVPGPKGWLQYADLLRDRLDGFGSGAFADTFGRIFNRLPNVTGDPLYSHLKPLHQDLVNLPFASWTTTNFDMVLENSFEAFLSPAGGSRTSPKWVCVHEGNVPDLSPAIRGIARNKVSAAAKSPDWVIHWHGVYGTRSTIILGARDYERAYGFTDLRPSTPGTVATGPIPPIVSRLFMAMAALMLTRQVVFLGFSLDDPYVAAVLARIADALWEWGAMAHFAVLPLFVGDPADERKQREDATARLGPLGVKAVWFPVENGDFSGLERLIAQLRKDVERDSLIRLVSHPATPTPAATSPVEAPVRPSPEPTWLRNVKSSFGRKGARDED